MTLLYQIYRNSLKVNSKDSSNWNYLLTSLPLYDVRLNMLRESCAYLVDPEKDCLL